MSGPIICFGQQPCGFFPRRFLFAKFETARRLRAEIGGEIVFFYHDADHDPRETQTTLRHRKTGEPAEMNFAVENKVQRKWSPLYAKRIAPGWQATTARQLGAYAEAKWVEAFKSVAAPTVAEFCLEMYRQMGLLEGVRVVRSGDPAVRRAACAVNDFFVDVPYDGEVVRAGEPGAAGKPLFFDSLSFLPDDLADIGRAGLGAMIADISEIIELRDADNVPRYHRNFAANDPAIDKAVARLANSPYAHVALKGSDIGKRPGCAVFLQCQSTEMIGEPPSTSSPPAVEPYVPAILMISGWSFWPSCCENP